MEVKFAKAGCGEIDKLRGTLTLLPFGIVPSLFTTHHASKQPPASAALGEMFDAGFALLCGKTTAEKSGRFFHSHVPPWLADEVFTSHLTISR
ncbi:MAG: hypothetical protein WA672_03075, partial [Candidatus Angelobacter sp.]